MNLTFTFSLEQRVLANVAITLWSQDDVRDLMSQYALHILQDKWHEIENVVIQKSFKLRLPERLKEKLLRFIVRVGAQLISWVDVHHCNYGFVRVLPATFVWTSLGTINNTRTAKLLVLGGTLDGCKSFALACTYCLVEEMKYCWNVYDLSLQSFKFKGVIASYWFDRMYKSYLEELVNTYSPLMSIDESFLQEAIESGNEAATRYFLNMRNEEAFIIASAELAAVTLHSVDNSTALQRCSGVMMFILSKMNAEQQANLIMNYTDVILKCFLVWPLHSLFFDIVIKYKWNYISETGYINLLSNIVDLMHWEYNLHALFGEFWQQSPETYKQFIIDKGDVLYLLTGLCKVGDKKNFKLILKDILKMESKPIFACLISLKQWNSIKFLIKECLPSQGDLIAFRHIFKNHVHKLLSSKNFWKKDYSKFQCIKCNVIISMYQWDTLFQLVDDCVFEKKKKKGLTK